MIATEVRSRWMPIAAGALLAATGAPALQEETFRESLIVTAVEIPVQVLRDGKPVRGLTSEDFELYDRGERQEIVGFEVLDLSRAEAALRGGEAAVPEPSAAVASPTPRPRHFLLLFDFDFSRPDRLVRAVRGARRMLADQLQPTDRVATAVIAGNTGTKLLTGFTRDRATSELGLDFVEALLDRDRKRQKRLARELTALWGTGDEEASAAVQRLSRQLGLSAALAITGGGLPEVMGLDEYDALSGAGGVGRAAANSASLVQNLTSPNFIDSRAVEMETGLHAIKVWGEALTEIATLLRDVPEPKHLVLFSEGFSSEFLDNRETQGRALNRVEPPIEALQAAGWPVQAIDVEGIPDPLAVGGRSAADFEDPTRGQLVSGGARGQVRGPMDLEGFDAQALFHLAEETGGQLVENFNDLAGATELALERISVTYLLVFQPRDLVADGSEHRLEVKLRDGLGRARIVHRPSYWAPKPVAERSPLELSLDVAGVVAGDRTIREIPASVLVVPRPAGGGLAAVPVVVEVPGAGLVRGRREGAAELEIRAYGVAADTSLNDLLVQRVKLDLAKLGERLEAGGLRFHGALELPPGEQSVRIVVRDLGSGEAFVVSERVDVPETDGAAAGGAALLMPPVFLDLSGSFLDMRQSSGRARADGGAGPSGDPFAFGERTLVPSAETALAAGDERLVLLVVYPPEGEKPPLEVRVVTAGGAPVEGADLRWLERLDDLEDGGRRYLVALRNDSLAPGAYRLELLAAEPGGARAASTPFTVASR